MTDLFSECELAAKNRDFDAQLALAKMYQEGELVTKDLNQTYHWLTKSASNDNATAEYSLSRSYLDGLDWHVIRERRDVV